MNILTIFILRIHEHRIHFHLFVSSLISFINVLWFSAYKSFTFLVTFIPKYVIIFDAIENGIVFLISTLDNSLLVYRSVTDFCMLIFYSATLLNLFICSKSFLRQYFGFSTYKIMSSENMALPFLFLILKEKLSVSPLSIMLTVGVS